MVNDLWTEKYRPKELSTFDAPEYIKNFLNSNSKQHLLLYGPPGSGKTTFAQMLNPTIILNASDERGIDTIRKLKSNARTLKRNVILLDECENLTKDSQTCLRRMLEDYDNCTFIFATNYFSKIINPLKSRLLKFKFTGKSNNILYTINKSENINLSNNSIERIFLGCNKDLRRSINVLQGIKGVINFKNNTNDDINTINDLIDNFIGIIPKNIINNFFKINISNLNNFVDNFIREGYSVLQLITQISTSNIINKDNKNLAEFYIELGKLESKSFNGCSDEIILRKLINNKINLLN